MGNLDKAYAESIAKEYMPEQTTKIRQLKKLDAKAKKPALILAWTLGIAGTLIFGCGMCFALEVFGKGIEKIVIAIVLGIIGGGLCAVNYSIYKKVLKKSRQKYAFEIIELAKEIAEENT